MPETPKPPELGLWDYAPGYWSSTLGGHCYRGTAITIDYMERRMRGEPRYLMDARIEDIARRMVWC